MLRPEYSLGPSEYNPFLFAAIGEDKAGMPLTVLTALTRLGLDPWQEAGRLSDLPRESAAVALAATIATLPQGDWKAADSGAIAARLVAWLPGRSDVAVSSAKAARVGGTQMKQGLAPGVFWGVLAVAFLLLTLHMQGDNNLEPDANARVSIQQ